MKTPHLLLFLWLVLFSAAPLSAAFENATFEVTDEPQMPAVLVMDGLREGRVGLAMDVDAYGQLTDWLVTAATHQELIRPCIEAVRRWRFRPARFAGEAVPARLELTINLSQAGAVVSRLTTELVRDRFEHVSGWRMDYQVCAAAEVDRPLLAIHRVRPAYAREAQQLGVGGRVQVHFFVDETGAVRLPAVPAETHPYLSAIATEAMRSWKFEPPTRRGRPVLVAAIQEFDFGGPP